jgi:hypothetical protein
MPHHFFCVLGVWVAVFLTAAVELRAEAPVSFELDVMPILTARGCNAGACHGKQRGQNGFQLSLLGFDPEYDYAALTKNARGRRVFPAAPERSLLLQKPTGEVPHGGGVRLERGDADYDLVRRWIAQGMPRQVEGEPKLERVVVEPAELLMAPGEEKPLRVTAFYSDGSSRDVTARTSFQSNESAIVAVSPTGVLKAGPIPGETAIMGRYMTLIAVTNVAIPLAGDVPDEVYANLPRYNFIDDLVWQKLKSLGITPSGPADHAKFLRRAYLDIIGRLPSAEEARAFLTDGDSQKRERLVDSLLERPEYADHWANKWADLLRPNPYRVGIKATFNFDNWIRDQFRQNRPYDQFVRDLLTAQGSTWRNGATTLFRDRREPEEIGPMVSRLFLGVRLDCAKCHHHPFEKWGQEDFYSFAAYFARVQRKGAGISPPISGGEEMVMSGKKGSVEHPLTGETMTPRPLFGEAPIADERGDLREPLAAWIASDQNEYFARVQVNRVWADLMGRGIVDPVDDLRTTNPPTNEPLLAALAAEFRAQKFDLKKLIRTITTSYVYALSSLPHERNAADTRNYSRHYRERLRAEVLANAVDDITGVPTEYEAMPPRSRANQIWTHRVDSLFLDTFGRPDPNQDPPCERTSESTVTQTLHLMNAPAIHAKVTNDDGLPARLAAGDKTPEEITEELYLAVYSRFPDEEELAIARQFFQQEGTNRRQAAEDMLWALLNTPEFIFKD